MSTSFNVNGKPIAITGTHTVSLSMMLEFESRIEISVANKS
jgi:uncharacterized Zn-binding protein involved in type VI secretion